MLIKISLLGLTTLFCTGFNHASAGRVEVYKNFLNPAELEDFLDSPQDLDVGGGLQTGYAVLQKATAKRIHEVAGLADQTSKDFYDSEERFRVLLTQQLKSSSRRHRDHYMNEDLVEGKVGIIFLETNPDAALVADFDNVNEAETIPFPAEVGNFGCIRR